MKIQILSSGGKPAPVEAQAKPLSSSDRAGLMLKRAGASFLLAVASVFIPIFHFFLVPLFLFLTVYFGWKARKARYLVPALKFACPACGANVETKSFYLEEELRSFCPQCRDQYKITVSEGL